MKTSKKSPISLEKEPKSRDFFEERVAYFKEKRNAQYVTATQICDDLLYNGMNVAVRAEEKSGKREIMECVHCLLSLKKDIVPHSVYVTALDRKDTKVQFVEIEEEYGITSLVARDWSALLKEVVNILSHHPDRCIYIHMDEDDYGTGDKQNMAKIYNYDGVGNDRVLFVGYSATPEELEASSDYSSGWSQVQFTPDPSYFGAKKYLERGLVREPHTFFDGQEFTSHAIGILSEIRQNCVSDLKDVRQRNVIVVRDVTPKKLGIITARKSEFEDKYLCEVHVFDMHAEFKWGDLNSWKDLGRTPVEDEDGSVLSYTYKPVVIFISQTCTRSTEICPSGHRRLYAWHDVRKFQKSGIKDKTSNYNTLSQAIGRVKHYTQPGKLENRIFLFCDRAILEFTVNPESVLGPIKLSARVKTVVTKEPKKTVEYEDRYQNVSDVLDTEWMTGDPRVERPNASFHLVKGKWCHYDKKIRYFGDVPPGGGGIAGIQYVLQYESPASDRYIIRKATFIENPSSGNKSHTFETTSKSMYS
tara:strand:- start:5090 stop:6679 length:1590 start_codon:yes stop_codon:yes gene_type:complete